MDFVRLLAGFLLLTGLLVGPRVAGAQDSSAVERNERGTNKGQPDWLVGLQSPDFSIRWDDALRKELTAIKNHKRRRAIMQSLINRSGAYESMIEKELQAQGLPKDLICTAMIESGLNPIARSSAGAVGMWQFLRATAEELGLVITPWQDQRRDPTASTKAAATYLAHLHKRFGTWDLALAAYNMGYGALLRAMKKFNSNDIALLSSLEGGLPQETVQYVSRIKACAVSRRNPHAFGLSSENKQARTQTASVEVPGGEIFRRIASRSKVSRETLVVANPQLLVSQTPPGEGFELQVPLDVLDSVEKAIEGLHPERFQTVRLRLGETLRDIATRYGISKRRLLAMNRLESESLSVGTSLKVPKVEPEKAEPSKQHYFVAVPKERFVYPLRRRLYYRTVPRDTLQRIADTFSVTVQELSKWNHVVDGAVIAPGLMLQVFVQKGMKGPHAVTISPQQVTEFAAPSDALSDHLALQEGRARISYTIQSGDSLSSVAQHFDLRGADLARINQLSPRAKLSLGETLIVYAPLVGNGTAPEGFLDDVSDKETLQKH